MSFGFVPSPVPDGIRRRADETLAPHFPDDLDLAWRQIAAGTAQLWVADGGTSALVSRRYGDALEIWLMAGERSAVANLPTIEAAARDAGVSTLQLLGRPGWARLLKDWRVVARRADRILMKKELADGR